jgi:hypothetical protein
LVATLVGRSWREPLATESPWGETVFEWWSGQRKLTVYYSPKRIEYIRVWGPDIDSEMETGTIDSPVGFARLWTWLSAK